MNALIKTEQINELNNVYQFPKTTSNFELHTFQALSFEDDIDSFFSGFKDDPEFKKGMIHVGNDIADSLYGTSYVNLKTLRLRLGLTQKDLCEITGMHQPALARLESGDSKDPKLSTLEKLSEALSESIETIIFAFKASGDK